jgi:hypothetical protein
MVPVAVDMDLAPVVVEDQDEDPAASDVAAGLVVAPVQVMDEGRYRSPEVVWLAQVRDRVLAAYQDQHIVDCLSCLTGEVGSAHSN